MTKTITENRREFVKNNNIIVKINNYDEACDTFDIIADILGLTVNHTLFTLIDIMGADYSDFYLVKKVKNTEIVLVGDISKYKDSKEVYHEFPTRNFIDAFMD